MAIQTEPTRIQIPFADSGTKNVIPDTNSTPSASQAASWTDGFPAQCSLPLSAGGIPPARADFNGIFNTMTQSERFTQEGGVWAWDATVDYGTNRVVLGSDNILYWSVAQSGPNVGGAQDPTADDGTYWQAPFAKTMPPLENSGAVASTKWVRDAMAAAPIYIDGTGGSDSNDGLTAATAVKTVAQALALGEGRTGVLQTFYIAGGTYAEHVSLKSKTIELVLGGDVVFSDALELQNSDLYVAENNTYSLTVTSSGSVSVYIRDSSHFFCYSPFNITTANAGDSLRVTGVSSCLLNKDLSISGTSVTRAIAVRDNSEISVYGDISITGSSITYGINVEISSCCSFNSDITMANVGMACAFSVSSLSAVLITGGNVSCFSSGVGAIRLQEKSYFYQASGTKITATHTGSGAPNSSFVNIETNSCADFNGDLDFQNTASTGCFFYVSAESFLGTYSSSITLNGTVSAATINCRGNSHAFLNYATSISGTVTGKRYDISVLASINTGGKGANFFPGTVAGTAASASYGYYG